MKSMEDRGVAVVRRLARRIRYLLRHRRFEADLAEELDFHEAQTRRALEQTGLTPSETAAATRRALGSIPLARNEARDVWIGPWVQSLAQDLRFALRLLVTDRGFTIVAVLALAAGIGVNTTVFTFVNAILLRGLPTDHPERIMYVSTRDARTRSGAASFLDFRDWQAAARTFDGLAAFQNTMMNVGDEGRALERLTATFVSANTFHVVGEQPALGRDFLPDDDRPGAPPVVILGSAIWRSRYGADAQMIGRTILVDRVPVVVIGVMPDGFKFPFNAELWRPLASAPGLATQTRDARRLAVVGRLAPGVSVAQAQADLATIGARLARDHAATNKDIVPVVTTYNARFNGGFSLVLLTMLGAVGVLLVIACANVASLLLARSARRAREIAVRVSLGATRGRIVRQLIVESLVLAALGGLLGLALSVGGVRLFARAVDSFVKPYWIVWTMDARVFAFLAIVCLGTAVVFGLAPALHVARTDVDGVLKDGGRAGGGGLRVRRWTGGLVTAEVAMTLIVLAAAGFMVRSFLVLHRADLVIDTRALVMARVTLSDAAYAAPAQRLAFAARLEERFAQQRAAGAIGAATLTGALPFTPIGVKFRELEVDRRAPGDRAPSVATITVDDRYFDALGLRLPRGRVFASPDGTPGQERAIVNERFVTRFLAGEDPIGRRIRLGEPPAGPGAPASASRSAPAAWLTIVGVAPTVRQTLDTPDAVVYLPLRAEPDADVTMLVRGAAGVDPWDPAPVVALMREEVRAIDPDVALHTVLPMEKVVAQSRWRYQVFSVMFALFAGVALVLSAVGLYAVTAYAVTQRTQEIGLRMALGAGARQVWWLVLRRALAQLAAGLVIGLAGAFGVGRLLASLLVGTSARDPITLAAIAALLIGVSLAACAWPARRAMRLDPAAALRKE